MTSQHVSEYWLCHDNFQQTSRQHANIGSLFIRAQTQWSRWADLWRLRDANPLPAWSL